VANPEHLAGAGSDHLDAPDAVSGAHLGRDLVVKTSSAWIVRQSCEQQRTSLRFGA
jgi:hypothetical protein